MLLAERQSVSISSGVNPTDALRLRVPGDHGGERFVALPIGKTTIGSSPRCNVRIQQPGVHPLHCLIVREAETLTVRRWAAGTRLNGQPFDEAPLLPGDRLTVGTVELEIEHLGNSGGQSDDVAEHSPAAVAPSDQGPAGQEQPPSSPAGDAITSENIPLQAKLQQLAEATGQLAEQKATLAAGIHDLYQRLSRAEQRLASCEESPHDWQNDAAQRNADHDEWRQQGADFERHLTDLESRLAGQEQRVDAIAEKIATLQRERNSAQPNIQPATMEPRPEQTFDDASAGPHPPSEVLPVDGPQEAEDEVAPFAEFSIWNQGAQEADSEANRLTDAIAEEGAAASTPETHAEPAGGPSDDQPTAASCVAEPLAVPSPQSPPAASFIERYSHMFADESAPAEPSPPVAPPQPPTSDELLRKPRNMEVIRRDAEPQPPASDDEDSIEQYMAKLLQRVRGDGPRAPASQAPGVPAASLPPDAAVAAYPSPPLAPAAQILSVAGGPPVAPANSDWLTSLGTVRRKAMIVEDTADLKTFRALANESARRAISTHGLRTHRRNAITKVIVSTLAGMTSLWLMLEAPDWRDLQFITACVSLLVAAYWAGQTYAELIETLRAAAYDGPEDELDGFAEPFRSDLPIDVPTLEFEAGSFEPMSQ